MERRSAVVAALAVACTHPTPPPVVAPPAPGALRTLAFAPPVTDGVDLAALTAPIATAQATVDGVPVPIGYRVLRRSGPGFGGVRKQGRAELVAPLCEDQDFDSLLPLDGGRAALISHFECVPGGMYVTPLDPDPSAPGEWIAGASAPVDWDALGGLWFPCSGQISPWGTHLGSEEYEPDVRTLAENPEWRAMVDWYADPADADPYRYGWATEVALDGAGTPSSSLGGPTPTVHKRYALGRFSHELSFVLPDRRTVYQSDDGTGVGLFLFVADQPDDLTAGALFAARFTTDAATPPESARVTWIPLGHAAEGEVAALIARRVGFADLFDVGAAPTGGVTCEPGFTLVLSAGSAECLRLQPPSERVPDPALAASRLETRRYAAYVGADHELEKAEGLAFDPETGTVYLSLSALRRRTGAEVDLAAAGVVDGLRLTDNRCGAVVALPTLGPAGGEVRDHGGAPMPTAFAAVSLRVEVAGVPLAGEGATGCDPDRIAGPDNLTLLPGYGLLAIGEDTGRHANARLWAYDVRTRALTPMVIAPPDGEITGIHWVPDLYGRGYLTLVVQHPWARRADPAHPELSAQDPDQRAFTGYIGPFPSLRVAPR